MDDATRRGIRRRRAEVELGSVDRAAADPTDEERAEAALARLAASAELARADAALAWLDVLGTEPRLAYAPRADRPRRGRRPGTAAAAAPAGTGAQPADA